MADKELRIRWSPKVRQDRIARVYRNDAAGITDETLIDDVGLALYLRCSAILMHAAGKALCPNCREFISFTGGVMHEPDALLRCPDCGWETTFQRYRDSYRTQDLGQGQAGPVFRSFVELYPRAGTPRDRLLLIDRLLHAFHQSLQVGVPWRSAANNLIEGSHEDVVAFLDRLTYGDSGTPELRETHGQWQESVQQMWDWRRGSGRASSGPLRRRNRDRRHEG